MQPEAADKVGATEDCDSDDAWGEWTSTGKADGEQAAANVGNPAASAEDGESSDEAWGEWTPTGKNASENGAASAANPAKSAKSSVTEPKQGAASGAKAAEDDDSDDAWGDWSSTGNSAADPAALAKLSVKELKQRLSDKKISLPLGAVEKSDLIRLLIAAPSQPTPAPGSGGPGSGGQLPPKGGKDGAGAKGKKGQDGKGGKDGKGGEDGKGGRERKRTRGRPNRRNTDWSRGKWDYEDGAGSTGSAAPEGKGKGKESGKEHGRDRPWSAFPGGGGTATARGSVAASGAGGAAPPVIIPPTRGGSLGGKPTLAPAAVLAAMAAARAAGNNVQQPPSVPAPGWRPALNTPRPAAVSQMGPAAAAQTRFPSVPARPSPELAKPSAAAPSARQQPGRRDANLPVSSDEALARAGERLLFPGRVSGAAVAQFKDMYGLGDTVALGLRILPGEAARQIMENPLLRSRLGSVPPPADKDWEVLLAFQQSDHPAVREAEAIVRKILEGTALEAAMETRKRGQSASGSSSSSTSTRTRNRHRGRPTKERRLAGKQKRGGARQRGRRGRRRRSSSYSSSSGSPRGGAGVRDSLGPAGIQQEADADEEELLNWLRNLDGGKGSLLQYFEPLKREFGNLVTVAACRIPGKTGPSVLDCVDELLFKALGVNLLGQRLLLARGVFELGEEF